MKHSKTFAFLFVAGILAGCSAAPTAPAEDQGGSTEEATASKVNEAYTQDPCASICGDSSDPYRTQNCDCCHRIQAAHHYIACYQ